MYNPEDEDAGRPGSAARLIESCQAADGLLWSSPMYQGTISSAQERTRLASPARQARPALPARQGDRPDQRRRRNAGAAGDQHDGVRGPCAARVACAYVVPVAAAHRIFDRGGSRTRGSSCSSRRSGPRSCGLPSGSPTTSRSTASTSAPERRARGRRLRLAQPEGDRSPSPRPSASTQVSLAEQLDLVGWVPKLSRLDGLEGEPAVPLRHGDAGQEVAGLAGPGLPIRRDLGSCDVPPGRASLERVGRAHVQRAGHGPEWPQRQSNPGPAAPRLGRPGLRPERSRWRAGSRRAGGPSRTSASASALISASR